MSRDVTLSPPTTRRLPPVKETARETDVIDDPANQVPDSCGENPHFTACLKSQFNNVFMVADSRALQGKSLGLIADYMVMLALSQPRSLDGCNALPSVIDVLAKTACPGREPPDGLTPADAAYLTALYSSDPERSLSRGAGPNRRADGQDARPVQGSLPVN